MKLIGSNTLTLNTATMQNIIEEWLEKDHQVKAKVTSVKARQESMCPVFDVTFEAKEEQDAPAK